MRVIIESPYAGDVERNTRYVRACLRDSLLRGEAPFASHALYTLPGVLDDLDPAERKLSIEAGFQWRTEGAISVFYVDLGWSPGMEQGREDCYKRGLLFEIRQLGADWDAG